MTPSTVRFGLIGVSVLIVGLAACATPALRPDVRAQHAATQCLTQKGGNPDTCAPLLAALDVQCQMAKQTYDANGGAIPTRYVWVCTTAQQRAAMQYAAEHGWGSFNGQDVNGPVPSVGPMSGQWTPTTASVDPGVGAGAGGHSGPGRP